jgi:hypothetical protein
MGSKYGAGAYRLFRGFPENKTKKVLNMKGAKKTAFGLG